MKRAGVIGYPLTHSTSPAIFKAAFEAAGVEAKYEAWPTEADQLEGRINALRGDDMLGANVTIPHKEAVVPLIDRLDPQADLVGAVNTIVHDDGDLVGYNTDVAGFGRALVEDAGFDAKGKRTVVLGAGGAARAVALSLIESRASTVLMTGRSPRRLTALVNDLRAQTVAGVTLSWAYWQDGSFLISLPKADLIVNCTPIGTLGGDSEGESPLDAKLLPENGTVFDLVYNPAETPLLKATQVRGAKAVSGLGMLVYQAAESFRLWTGQDADTAAMLAAGRQALSGP